MTESNTVTGTLTKVSRTEGKNTGFLINGTWYNGTRETNGLMAGYNEGQTVKVEFIEKPWNDKVYHNVLGVELVEEGHVSPALGKVTPQYQGKPSPFFKQNDPAREQAIVRQTCIKAASEVAAALIKESETTDLVKAAETTILLAAEYEKWITR